VVTDGTVLPASGDDTRPYASPQSILQKYGKKPQPRIFAAAQAAAAETACIPPGTAPCRWQRALGSLDWYHGGGESSQPQGCHDQPAWRTHG
jgi:hypothetical protein